MKKHLLHWQRCGIAAVVLAAAGITGWLIHDDLMFPTSERAHEAAARVRPRLEQECAAAGLRLGAPVFMRAFKESKELEIWLEAAPGERYRLFRTYPIKTWGSGRLGPKLKEGDGQAPEGFYTVSARQLNPNSSFHLAFNLGFPNEYDRSLGRAGSHLMVHGAASSIGCYAMTDPLIEEIYTLAAAALGSGQRSFQVQCLPFRFTSERMAQAQKSEWHDFWNNLRTGSDLFDTRHRPVDFVVRGRRYVFREEF